MNYEHPKRKTKVVFVQLGSPSEPTTKALRKYLRAFLGDPRVVDINRLNGPGRSHTYTAIRVLRHRGLLHLTLWLHRGIAVILASPHCIYPIRLQLIFRRSDQLDVGWFGIEGYRLW